MSLFKENKKHFIVTKKRLFFCIAKNLNEKFECFTFYIILVKLPYIARIKSLSFTRLYYAVVFCASDLSFAANGMRESVAVKVLQLVYEYC